MITEWKLANFKSVQAETTLPISPLTVLAGPNSAGKSTLLQSILVIAQTLARTVSAGPIALNGSLARLGNFSDVKCFDVDNDDVTIGWVCKPSIPFASGSSLSETRTGNLISTSVEIRIDASDADSPPDTRQSAPRLRSMSLAAKFRSPESRDIDDYSIAIQRSPRRSLGDAVAGRRLHELPEETDAYDVELDSGSLADLWGDIPSARPVGCALQHFLPTSLFISVDVHDEYARFLYAALTSGLYSASPPRPRTFYMRPSVPHRVADFVIETLQKIVGPTRARSLREEWYSGTESRTFGVPLDSVTAPLRTLPAADKLGLQSALAGSDVFQRLVHGLVREHAVPVSDFSHALSPGLATAGQYVTKFFGQSILYLGPLRDEPKPFYPRVAGIDPGDVGSKGEHTAAVLHLQRDTVVKYVPTAAFEEDSVRRLVATSPLADAVAEWLQYLGVADDVDSENMGKFGHQLTVSFPYGQKIRDLTHVGVGVSQALPIVVASLLADSGTTLLFEQPELHLHPRVQTLLGDFFLSMTHLDKQCIIETHSEHIVNRLRLRTAMLSDAWRDPVKIYFVERGDNGTSFSDVVVNEYGAILDWPEGFFDEGQREAESILQAATARRRTRRAREKRK